MQMTQDKYTKETNAIIGELFIDLLTVSGLLHDRDIRNITIRRRYRQMIDSGTKDGEAKQLLSDSPYYTTKGQKYFLTVKTIEKIIYPKRNDNAKDN